MLLVQHYGPKGRQRQKQGGTRPDDKARFAAFRQLAERFFAQGGRLISMKKIERHIRQRERGVPAQLQSERHFRGQQQHGAATAQAFFGQFHIYGCLAASGHAEQQVRRGIPGIKIRTERSQRRLLRFGKREKGFRCGRQQVAAGFLFRTTGFEALQANQTVLEQRLERRGDSLPHLPQYFPPGNGAMFQQELQKLDLARRGRPHSPRRIATQYTQLAGGGVFPWPEQLRPSPHPRFTKRSQNLYWQLGQILQQPYLRLALRFHRTETHLRHPKPRGEHHREDLPRRHGLAQSKLAHHFHVPGRQQRFLFQRPKHGPSRYPLRQRGTIAEDDPNTQHPPSQRHGDPQTRQATRERHRSRKQMGASAKQRFEARGYPEVLGSGQQPIQESLLVPSIGSIQKETKTIHFNTIKEQEKTTLSGSTSCRRMCRKGGFPCLSNAIHNA